MHEEVYEHSKRWSENPRIPPQHRDDVTRPVKNSGGSNGNREMTCDAQKGRSPASVKRSAAQQPGGNVLKKQGGWDAKRPPIKDHGIEAIQNTSDQTAQQNGIEGFGPCGRADGINRHDPNVSPDLSALCHPST